MRSLDELLAIDGVKVACEFALDGTPCDVKSKMGLPDGLAERAAQYIATVTMMFDTLGGAFTKESGMSWAPQRGWSYSGGDWTVVVAGNRAVFADTDIMDAEALMSEIAGERKEERIEHRM